MANGEPEGDRPAPMPILPGSAPWLRRRVFFPMFRPPAARRPPALPDSPGLTTWHVQPEEHPQLRDHRPYRPWQIDPGGPADPGLWRALGPGDEGIGPGQ